MVLNVFSLNSYAQTKATVADKKYNSYAYFDAIKTYEKEVDRGNKSIEMFQKLGNSYYFNANLNRILNTKLLPNSESYLSKINVPATHQS